MHHHVMYPLLCLLLAQSSTLYSAERQDTIVGRATYYSDKFQGRKMSNGEKYHRDSLTCAHMKLPFGTMLKVTNQKNNKEVILRVTDRGPHSKRFIIDVSRAAAETLGFSRDGVAKVQVVILSSPKK